MPDFDTRPIGPLPVMVCGVMPASDSPGVMMPGQFGPIMRVLLALQVGPDLGRVLHRDALGDDHDQPHLGVDGLDRRVLGERRRHEEDGHVRAGLGHGLLDGAEHGQRDVVARRGPCGCTVVPALRALTPPTIVAPESSIRAVCLAPIPPVMPWTMIFESEFR